MLDIRGTQSAQTCPQPASIALWCLLQRPVMQSDTRDLILIWLDKDAQSNQELALLCHNLLQHCYWMLSFLRPATTASH